MPGTAAGVRKANARRIGISLEEYERHLAAGERWCFACKAFQAVSDFHVDRSRSDGVARACKDSRNRTARDRHVAVAPELRRRPGPDAQAPRDDDRQQARARIALLVRTGRIPPAQRLPCVDCGHAGDDRRHEYDHHRGYGAEHHEDVEVVCTVCHAARSRGRGELVQKRGARGRYVSPH